MDKDRIDMVLEIDHIAETGGPYNIGRNRRNYQNNNIMVMEAIDLEMEIIKPIIGRMTGPIIEGKILTKIMAKEIEIEL